MSQRATASLENNQDFQKNQVDSSEHGGMRKGAGRKKSVLTVKTRAVAERVIEASAEGETPLEVMVRVMHRFWQEADHLLRSEDKDEQKSGLKLMVMAKDAASAAAPYIHPRLAAIEHTGKDGKALHPEAPKGVLVVPGVMNETDWERMMAQRHGTAA